MKILKRALCLALTLVFIASLCIFPAAAATSVQQYRAEALNNLGLFKGTDKGFDLDSALTREQAVTMVVRLLGAEDEALEKNYQDPFTDVPAWAAPYVGYAYANRITSGQGVTVFGAGQRVTQAQFLTFLLRVLSYRDGADFTWSDAYSPALKIGLLEPGTAKTDAITRADAVDMCYLALCLAFRGGTRTMSESLIDKGVFTAEDWAYAQSIALVGLENAVKPDNGGTGSGSTGSNTGGNTGGSTGSGTGGSTGNETEDIPLS